jgi:transglutaminase-like putative cysteine protease
VAGPLVEQLLADVSFAPDAGDQTKARALYEHVLATMEYKKIGSGWGNGDTYWACSEHYGNCTDFHALLTSLTRAIKIPTRFEIGFPIPEDRRSGKISGYHCWVNLYLKSHGWFPIDASEAWKHPERQDFFFGSQPADRVRFSVGRDLQLGEGHNSGPLNYFIHPLIEVGGRSLPGIRAEVRYQELSTSQKSQASSPKE